MSEDGILKHSLSGGYKDLIQTLDSALDENNRKLRELEDQILFLTRKRRRVIPAPSRVCDQRLPVPVRTKPSSGY